MWPSVTTAESPADDRASLHGKGRAMSDRDAGFCSGGEELESEGVATTAGGGSGSGGVGADDADEALSPTDASEDSVEVRVRPVAPPPTPPPRKRKCPSTEAASAPLRNAPTPVVNHHHHLNHHLVPTPPPKKRRLLLPVSSSLSSSSHVTVGTGAVSAAGPFRPWSVDCCDEDAVHERLRIPPREALLRPDDTCGASAATAAPSSRDHHRLMRIHPHERRSVVKTEPQPSEDGGYHLFPSHGECLRGVKPEPPSSLAKAAAPHCDGEASFSVAALLGASSSNATAGPSTSSCPSPSPSSSTAPSHPQQQQQRNYKNMTRERRIEANARERTRVHTISAAFDTLRRAVPAYSHAQKLSKLSVLRVACAYILTLSRAAGKDYSADASQPTLESCVDLVTRTIHTEGKLRRKRDE